MIQITPQMRILLASKTIDFRKGIDGLVSICKNVLKADPFSGYLFVFRSKKATAIKMLVYDGQGFWLCQKRLSSGRFLWWPTGGDDASKHLAAHELQLLLWNGNPNSANVASMWKKIQ